MSYYWIFLHQDTVFILCYIFIVPPVIIPFSFVGEANSGDNMQATCHVSKGDTPLQLTWTFHGFNSNLTSLQNSIKTLKVGEKINLLEIPEVTPAHRGNYTCSAQNKAGITNYTATLMVNGNYFRV